jgi:hypothetical protein
VTDTQRLRPSFSCPSTSCLGGPASGGSWPGGWPSAEPVPDSHAGSGRMGGADANEADLGRRVRRPRAETTEPTWNQPTPKAWANRARPGRPVPPVRGAARCRVPNAGAIAVSGCYRLARRARPRGWAANRVIRTGRCSAPDRVRTLSEIALLRSPPGAKGRVHEVSVFRMALEQGAYERTERLDRHALRPCLVEHSSDDAFGDMLATKSGRRFGVDEREHRSVGGGCP